MFYVILRADANALAAYSNICSTFFEMTFYPKKNIGEIFEHVTQIYVIYHL